MASYIPQITDSSQSLQTPTLAHDYSFLQAGLQKSNQQYQEGLQRVSNDYNAILNTQVTGQQMNDIKNKYVARVQEGLKKVAPTDLSLPKNVSQAENLYAPFWQDDALVYNAGYTKYSQGELAKLNSWKTSKDKEVWSRYNPYAERYIEQGLEDLANAPADINAYRKIQKRAAVPFFDIDKEVEESWVNEIGTGKGIESQLSTGAALYTQTNGIKSKDAYRTYYLSKVGDRYDEQYRVIASVKLHDAKSAILRQNPSLDDKALNEHLASDVLEKLTETNKSAYNSYLEQSQFWQKKMDELKREIVNNQKGIMTPEQQSAFAFWYDKAKSNGIAAQEYQARYLETSPFTVDGKVNPTYARTQERIATYPEEYLTGLEKQISAENWAAGRASVTSEKKELDPEWKAYTDLQSKQIDQQLRASEIAATRRGQDYNLYIQTGMPYPGGPQDPRFGLSHGWYGEPGEGVSTPGNGGDVIGTNTIDIAHIPQGVDIVRKALNDGINNVSSLIFNPDAGPNPGFSNIVLGNLGLSSEEIISVSEAAKVMRSGGNLDDKQRAAWNKAKTNLKEYGNLSYDILGPSTMESALLDYSPSVAKQLATGNPQQQELGKNLQGQYIKILGNRNQVLANERNVNKAIHNTLVTDPKFSKLTITNPDGTKREVTAEDMAHDFPELDLVSYENGKHVKLSPLEIGKLYSDGKFDYKGQGEIFIDGKKFQFANLGAFGTSVGLNNEYNFNEYYQKHILPKYGYSTAIPKLKQEITEKALTGMERFRNGIVSKIISWDPNASKKGDKEEERFALNLAPELALPGNTDKPYIYDYDKKEATTIIPKDEVLIRTILSNADETKSNVGSIAYTRNDQNEVVARITFQSKANADGNQPNSFSGKTVYMKVSPNASGKFMATVPQNDGIYVYSNLYDGGTVTLDSVMQSFGSKGSVTGYDKGPDGRARKFAISLSTTTADPDHLGQWIENPSVQGTVYAKDKTADQVMDAFYGSVLANMNKTVTNSKQARSKVTQGMTIQQFEQQLKNKFGQ